MIYLSPSNQSTNFGILDYGSEMEQMYLLCDKITPHLSRCGVQYHVPDSSMSIGNRVDEANEMGATLYLALHSNASGVANSTACGVVAFCYASGTTGHELATNLAQAILDLGQISNRDTNVYTGSRLYEVAYPKAPACLLEVDFHDCVSGYEFITKRRDDIAEAIARVLVAMYGAAWVEVGGTTADPVPPVVIVDGTSLPQVIGDLIYMNSDREDIGVLQNYELDIAVGADENDFECKVSSKDHCCEEGFYIYAEGTEYGGIVDSITSDTANAEVTYSGRTWHGILNSKIIEPDSGEAYLTLSGDAHEVIDSLLARLNLTDLFEVDSTLSGVAIQNYKMNRYIAGYDGIVKMLNSVGAKLRVIFNGSKVVLSATGKHDFTKDEEFDSDLVDFRMKKKFKTVNHLICLGSGELENRLVVHLYVDSDGNISQEQTQTGLDEYATVYDYSAVESEEELVASGKDLLKTLWEQTELSVSFNADTDNYEVGDIVGATDNVTRLSVASVITKKVVTVRNGLITISYEVGE